MRIVFCHNVYVRYRTLHETLKVEKELFPNSYSVVAYNDIPPPDHMKIPKVDYISFHGKTHKIGCTNGCITAIKGALAYNPDIVVFSHDDVMLNKENLEVFNKHVSTVYNKKYDAICRIPGNNLYGSNYYMMECFIMSGNAARTCFTDKRLYDDENRIVRDVRGSISPEVFLYDTLNDADLKILALEYEHKLEGYNETLEKIMGFTHINAGERGWHD